MHENSSFSDDARVFFGQLRRYWKEPINLLTLSRLILCPIPGILVIVHHGHGEAIWSVVAMAIYLLLAMTDWLDGFLARRLNLVTPFGAKLDAVVDKFFAIIILLPLVVYPYVGLFTAFMAVREIGLGWFLSWTSRKSGRCARVLMSGKIKTAVVVVTIAILYIPLNGHLMRLGEVAMWLSVLVSMISAIDYMATYWPDNIHDSRARTTKDIGRV